METISAAEVQSKFSLEYFQQASTLGALSESTLLWLLEQGEIFSLEKNEQLFQPDQRGDAFFVILQGVFAYYKRHQGNDAYIRDYQVGEQIGFMSMIALHNRVGRAIAKEDCLALKIATEVFHRLHEQAPMDFGLLMMNLAREMARTLRSVDNIVVDQAYREEIKKDN
ncbi:MAG: cyclic nucleotide-binding domain-containing protein [Motiliproteus sp.]|nr:cyclic nucleotide-binding domain-containing protein [Motiliproteus sp.]MCW9051056.1 cyclic nucleotide-binding domain-containing protein [Motiliproteus sp.]